MKCDFCDHDASIEIVVFVNGKAQKVRMCASCYQEKLAEMMGQIPKEWGGKELTDQLKEMLEKAQESGMMPGMEVSFLQPDEPNIPPIRDDENEEELISPEDAEKEEADDREEGHGENPFQFNPFQKLFASERSDNLDKNPEKTTNARDLALARTRRELRKRRRTLLEKMQLALQEENYELCAQYRDELNKIGDDLILLNEERKDPYGV